MRSHHLEKVNEKFKLSVSIVVILVLSVGLTILLTSGYSNTAQVTFTTPPSSLTITSPALLPAEKMQVARYTQNTLNLEGGGDDYSFAPLTLIIPTRETINQITMQVDGKNEKVEYGTHTPDTSHTTVFVWNWSTPLSSRLSNGIHSLSFEIRTAHHRYTSGFSVNIDTKSPRWKKEGSVIEITDNHELEGVTISLFDGSGVEGPVILEEILPSGKNVKINLTKTDNLVQNGKNFRVVSISDKAGNTTMFTQDDSRPFNEVIHAYAKKRIQHESLSPIPATFSGVDSPTYGPIYIFNVNSDTTPVPGNMWSLNDKKNNLGSAMNGGDSVIQNAGTGNGYSLPSLPSVNSSSFIVMDESTVSDFGFFVQSVTFEGPSGNINKNLVTFNQSDAASFSKFFQKMWAIKSSDFSKTPVLLIDIVNKTNNVPIMSYSPLGWIYINYSQLRDLGDPSGNWNFDLAKAATIFAHEMGHAYGLGHAKDTGNLQYKDYMGGHVWSKTQSSYVAGHAYSNGLKPQYFGFWFNAQGSGPGPDFTCSNRFLEHGKPDSGDPQYFEVSEDTFAGSFSPSQATTIEINDWVEYEHNWAKFCPITQQIVLATNQIERPNPPVAVPSKWEDVIAMIDSYLLQGKLPILEFAPYPGIDYPAAGIYACGCYTPCQVACGIAGIASTDPKADDKVNAQFLCENLCENDPNFIIKDGPKLKDILMATSNPQGESCAANTDTSSPNPAKWKPKGNFGNSSNDFCTPKDDCKMWEAKAGVPLICDFDKCSCKPKIITPDPPGH